MKLEIEALKNTAGPTQASNEEIAKINESKAMIEQKNQILTLQLEIKQLQSDMKDINDDANRRLHDQDIDHRHQVEQLHDHNEELEREKEHTLMNAVEQEKLLMSAAANFWFENFEKQKVQQQVQKGKGNFLQRLRNTSYKLGSGN